MILGQVSYLDCVAFLMFLAPQLLIQVGLLDTLVCGLCALPFLRECPIETDSRRIAKRQAPMLTPSSLPTSKAISLGEISHPEKGPIALRSAGHSIPGLCRPMCSLCLCSDSRQNWPCLLL